jgi:hypothetical protein
MEEIELVVDAGGRNQAQEKAVAIAIADVEPVKNMWKRTGTIDEKPYAVSYYKMHDE